MLFYTFCRGASCDWIDAVGTCKTQNTVVNANQSDCKAHSTGSRSVNRDAIRKHDQHDRRLAHEAPPRQVYRPTRQPAQPRGSIPTLSAVCKRQQSLLGRQARLQTGPKNENGVSWRSVPCIHKRLAGPHHLACPPLSTDPKSKTHLSIQSQRSSTQSNRTSIAKLGVQTCNAE